MTLELLPRTNVKIFVPEVRDLHKNAGCWMERLLLSLVFLALIIMLDLGKLIILQMVFNRRLKMYLLNPA